MYIETINKTITVLFSIEQSMRLNKSITRYAERAGLFETSGRQHFVQLILFHLYLFVVSVK